MYITVVILTVLVAILLMVIILMQSSKGGGLTATFGGGGGGDAMLSSRQAATMLHKMTTYMVAIFLSMCLLATLLSGRGSGEAKSVTSGLLQEQSAASGFNSNIPILPPETPGTGEEDPK